MDSSPPWMVYASRISSETAQGSSHEDQRPFSVHPTQRDPTAFTHAHPLSWKPSEGGIPCQPVCPRGRTSFHLQLIKIHTQKRLWHCYSVYSLWGGGLGVARWESGSKKTIPIHVFHELRKSLKCLVLNRIICSSAPCLLRMAWVTWGLTLGSANGQGTELLPLCTSHWNADQYLFGGTQWMDTY